MPRPRLGPPRFKPRPFADGNVSSEVRYTPHSKGRRNDQDYPAAASPGPPGWRDSRGGGGGGGGGRGRGGGRGGRPPFSKRAPLMGDRREPPPFNHWKSPNDHVGSFQGSRPSQMDPRRGGRPSPSLHHNRHHSPPPGHGRPSPSGGHNNRPAGAPSGHNGGPSPGSSRPNRSPHVPPHRSSSRSPMRGSPAEGGHRRPPPPPFHGPPPSSSHRPSHSPRHYHHPADRPTVHSPNNHGGGGGGSFRVPKRPPVGAFPQKEQEQRGGGRDPRGHHHSPRGRPYDRSPRGGGGNNGGGKPWNAPGGGGGGAFSPHHNGGPSGSQRKPRDLQGRGPYPERWPAVQDARTPHHGADRSPQSHSNAPPYNRPPPWKGGPPGSSSSYHHHHRGGHGPPPQRHGGELSRKRRMPDDDHNAHTPGGGGGGFHHPPPPLLEHGGGPPKHPRREGGGAPSLFSIPRPFGGGRPLSLRDKSRIVKGRQLRAESVLRLSEEPFRGGARPRPEGSAAAAAAVAPVAPAPKGTPSSLLALRKKRFQTTNAAATPAAAKTTPEPPPARRRSSSSPTPDDTNNESSRDSDAEAETEQVESGRSLSARSSSPIDPDLGSDLVVVSHWQAGPSSTSTSQGRSPPKERNKFKTERNANPDAPYSDHRGRYVDTKSSRPMNALHDLHRPGRPFRRPGPGPHGHNPRMRFNPGGPRRPGPGPPGGFRKPLMDSFVPRPFPQQTKPVFRKSQSIMSKYRNIQQARQRGPYNRGPSQRW